MDFRFRAAVVIILIIGFVSFSASKVKITESGVSTDGKNFWHQGTFSPSNYLPLDGSSAMKGNISMSDHSLTDVKTIAANGREVMNLSPEGFVGISNSELYIGGNLSTDGNVGIGTNNPLSEIKAFGMDIRKGKHSIIKIGNGSGYGGVVQTTDGLSRIMMATNLYNQANGGPWKRFDSNRPSAAVDIIGAGASESPFIRFVMDNNTGYPNTVARFESDRLNMKNRDIDNVAILNANTKNFVQPINSTHRAVYTSQESPMPRAVIEGSTTIENGSVTVNLPKHFAQVVSDSLPKLNTQVTPVGEGIKPVGVSKLSQRSIEISQISGKESTFRVDYRVTGVRSGHEEKNVVRPR